VREDMEEAGGRTGERESAKARENEQEKDLG
jgi:hypothetical protein